MAYREVGMLEVKEVLRLWLGGVAKKRIARQLGLDPKTVRRYVEVAEASGLDPGLGPPGLTEEHLSTVILALRPDVGRPKGDAWTLAGDHREMIRKLLDHRVRLSKIRRLLVRKGVVIPYPTLHRFAVSELDFGRTAATVPVADGEPGHEVQVDTGWMILLQPDESRQASTDAGLDLHCRRLAAPLRLSVLPGNDRLRHRGVRGGVGPTTAASSASSCPTTPRRSCRTRIRFIPRSSPASSSTPRPAASTSTRLASVTPRTRRASSGPSPPCATTASAARSCATSITPASTRGTGRSHEYGIRRHGSTQRLPLEHFEAEEKAAPAARADRDLRRAAVVRPEGPPRSLRPGRQGARTRCPPASSARRSEPGADRHTVRFYDGAVLVKTHPRETTRRTVHRSVRLPGPQDPLRPA